MGNIVVEKPGFVAWDPSSDEVISAALAKDARSACRDGRKPDQFSRFAAQTAKLAGGRWAFLVALFTVLTWAVLGPYCRYSENWQLVINTATTIVTFLMVFLIQNSQNRDSRAIQLKLDELIRTGKDASNHMIEIEHMSDDELDRMAEHYRKFLQRYNSESTDPGSEAKHDASDQSEHFSAAPFAG